MTRGIVITDKQIYEALKYLDELDDRMEDLTIPEDSRRDDLLRWQGARRVLKHMGLRDILKYGFADTLDIDSDDKNE